MLTFLGHSVEFKMLLQEQEKGKIILM